MAESSNNGAEPEILSLPGIMRTAGKASKVQNGYIPPILPHEKVFSVQIGNELFRLSGASISSDAPSYFSAFFQYQLTQAEQIRKNGEEPPAIRTLYIDRDPVTFGDISRHLQGYHVVPKNGRHFVKLFADAQFYQLPRLVDQLYEEAIYISIGGREFSIHKDIFSSPGDSPNYFTLGYAFLFSNSDSVFPGLKRDGLLRPPSILPPVIPHHSADIFEDLLKVLQGYPLHIRDSDHRKQLLQDCKYYLFKGVEQKLIPHSISFNSSRMREEIVLRLEDLRQTGLSCALDPALSDRNSGSVGGWVRYARPHTDKNPYELIVECGHEWMRLNTATMRAELLGDGKKRLFRLFEVIGNKLNLPVKTHPSDPVNIQTSNPFTFNQSPVNNDHVKFVFDQASMTIDGKRFVRPPDLAYEEDFGEGRDRQLLESESGPPRKKRRANLISQDGDVIPMIWTVKTGQWRIRVRSDPFAKGGMECTLVAVKIDAVSGEQARNEQRSFLAI